MVKEAGVTLTDAVTKGTRREALTALRDFLAGQLDGEVEAKSIAPIAKQLADVMRELDALPEAKEGSPSDQLAARRAARRSAPTGT